MNEAEQWWNGPPWLFDPSLWPADIVTKATDNSNTEKVQRELFALDFEANDDFDTLLEKFGLRKAMGICTWISRFNHISRHPSEKIIGPLTGVGRHGGEDTSKDSFANIQVFIQQVGGSGSSKLGRALRDSPRHRSVAKPSTSWLRGG